MTDNLLKVKDSIFKKYGCVWNGVRKKVFRIQVVLLILVLAAVSLDFMGLTALASTNTLSSTALPVADSGVGTQYYPFFQAGDFDNDGDIDILYQDGGMGTSVSFYKNNGSGVFTDDGIGHFPTTTNLNLNAPSFRAADYDNDGDLDIYCRQAGASNDSYFTNDGAGYFTPSSLPIADSGSNDIQWQACDFDGDGDVDILTQDGGAGTIIIYKNNGNGTSYVASHAITGSIAGLYLNILSTKIADFDNDGDMDIYARVTGGTSSSPNDIYLINDGFGNLTSAALPIPDTSGSNYTQYQVADMDNDGDVDFLTQDAGKGGDIRFFENNGSGVYTDQGTGRITGTKADMYLAIGATKIADYDNDGDLDIYARADGASNDLYFINNTVPSKITSYSPASNASNVGLNDNITLTLSNSSLLSKGSGQIYIRIDNGDGDFSNDTIFESIPVTDSRVALTGDSSSTTVTINPSGTFAPNTTYYLVIPPAAFLDGEEKGFVTAFGSRLHPGIPDPAKKQAGNSLHGTADRTVLSFSTISSEDAVNSVTVSPAAANVAQGGTQQLNATVSVTGGAAQTVNWTSSGVAQGVTVDGSGLVSAAANATPGDYTITATSTADGSKSGTATITVTEAPAVNSVTISPAAASVAQGGTQQLTATVSVTGGAAQTVSWTSSGVAQGVTVDGSGLVSAAANATTGEYTITATSTADGSKSGTATITVTAAPAVNSVTVSPASASVVQGGTQQLTATVSVTGGAAQTVSWTSSGVAQGVTVDGSGLVSAAANATPGDYTITATSTADGSKSGTATITVTAAPAVNSVTVSPAAANVAQGGTQQLTATVSVTGAAAQTVNWTSSGVAQGVTVNGSGLVSAAANATPGDYTITAASTADGSKSGTATITVTSPGALVLSVTPGNSLVKLSWASVTGAVQYKIYKDNILVETLSASENGYDMTGLVNGTIYTFEVKAADSNMIVIAASGQKTATPTAPSGSSTTQSPPPVNTNTGADILVNGKTENAGTVTTVKQGLQTVTTVSVDARKLEQKLEAEGNKAVVTIPVNVASDVVAGELNGQMVKIMESKEAVLEVKTGSAAYTLPAQQINIDAVAAQLGTNVELKDIKVKIQISKPAEETVKFIENSADKGNFSVVAPPVEFTVSCTYGGQTATVSSFNSYVERTIAIPEGIDPNKITTGVVNEPDGTVRHVPTKVTVINGKYYAVINSLTNSTYSVIWHPLEFKDAVNHWAMDAINDMGSRMVISGVGNGLFEPGRDITRAEFAAIIVRALGLKPGVGTNSFMDVDSGKWYCDYIKTAADYKIITGYSSGKFGPEDKITREQAMTMIAKAMKITRLEAGIEGKDTDVILSGFGDSAKAAAYAKESIAACVNAEIVTGKSGRLLAPKDEITRAEVAVIVRKLLQKSNLI